MAEEEEPSEGEEGEAPPKKKMSVMKLALFAGLPVIVLVLGGVAAMLLLGGGGDETAAGEEGDGHEVADNAHGGGHGSGGHGDGHNDASEVVFYELPDILVNIQAEGSRPTYLKLTLTLEVDSEETVHHIEPAMPRVMDRFQAFLRELRLEDLNGSAGSYRLRQELLRRVNLAVAPNQVRAVLIEEMLVQ